MRVLENNQTNGPRPSIKDAVQVHTCAPISAIQQRIKAAILSRIQLTPALWVPELMAEGQVLAP